jgi:hypothetical protein
VNSAKSVDSSAPSKPRRPQQYYGGVPLSSSAARKQSEPSILSPLFHAPPPATPPESDANREVEVESSENLLPPGEQEDDNVESSVADVNSSNRQRKGSVMSIEKDPLMAVPLTGAEGLSPEEARSSFFELLKDKKVMLGMSWVDALPKIANDKRYKVVKSLQEKKRLFEEYLRDLESMGTVSFFCCLLF